MELVDRETLVSLLLSFGFKEITEKRYKGNINKRAFKYNRCTIYFDYNYINFSYNSVTLESTINKSFTINNLKSLFYFLQTDSNTRYYLKERICDIISIDDFFIKEMSNTELLSSKAKKRLEIEYLKYQNFKSSHIMKQREGTILGSIKENQVDKLMQQYDLSAYEAMDIVLKYERNKILEDALIQCPSDKAPNFLEDVAISLRDLTKRENE